MIFNIATYGEKYLPYLKVCVESILHTHGSPRIRISHSQISEKSLKPFRNLSCIELVPSAHCIPPGVTDIRRTVPLKMGKWLELAELAEKDEEHVLLDVDTLVLRNLGHFFEEPFDVTFTYKTEKSENLKWPLNTGVVLFRGGSEEFFRKWHLQTLKCLVSKSSLDAAVRGWGAADQAALGAIVGFKHGAASFDPVVVDGHSVKGVPCRLLNEARCVPMGLDTHVVHYKGSWRKVLPEGSFYKSRPKDTCQAMFDLWKFTLKAFEERAK